MAAIFPAVLPARLRVIKSFVKKFGETRKWSALKFLRKPKEMDREEEFHCKRCHFKECEGCQYDADTFFIQHPDEVLTHNFGCPTAKPGEPIDLENRCLHCKDENPELLNG